MFSKHKCCENPASWFILFHLALTSKELCTLKFGKSSQPFTLKQTVVFLSGTPLIEPSYCQISASLLTLYCYNSLTLLQFIASSSPCTAYSLSPPPLPLLEHCSSPVFGFLWSIDCQSLTLINWIMSSPHCAYQLEWWRPRRKPFIGKLSLICDCQPPCHCHYFE